MIQLIGIIVAAYTTARLLAMVTRTGDRKEHVVASIVAMLAMLAIGYCGYGLLTTGTQSAPTPTSSGSIAP